MKFINARHLVEIGVFFACFCNYYVLLIEYYPGYPEFYETSKCYSHNEY